MKSSSAAVIRPEVHRVLRASEVQRSFHDRVLDGMRKFLEDHAMEGKTGARDFYDFEKALHARLMEAEREIMGSVMSASDVDADAIEIDGRVHRRVLRSAQTYMTAAGAVNVERWLYKDRRDPTADAAAEGRTSKGPAGYRELGCATLAFCDAKGDLISAIRFGRGPESKKVTLKDTLRKDLAHVLAERPHLRLAKITDAGGDNWEYTATLPPGPEILDFFHATEHLAAAIAAIHGDGTLATRHKFEFLRERLLTEDGGINAVIAALAHLKRKHPRLTKVAKMLAYFRKNRHRMRYAEWKRDGYMIGSGVVEAACKTLVAQRLKLSGMRWGMRGAQAILTMRGWDQSERFDDAWTLVAATYQRDVHILANVVDITPKPAPKERRRASR